MNVNAPRPRSRAEAKRLTRRALLEAGLEECSERGLDAPSLDQICARAGYTRGAFYVHFKDRDDFVVALMDWVLGSALDALLGPGDNEPLEAALERFAEAASTGVWPLQGGGSVPTRRIAEALERSEAIRESCSQLLQRAALRLTKLALHGQEAFEIRRDVSASQIAQLVLTLATGAVTLRQGRVPLDTRRLRSDLLTVLRG